MITFHPTISWKDYRKALRCTEGPEALEERLGERFPGCSVTLVDSGRSALARTIEALNLEGARIALPAYLCNVLIPILERYRITPVFLDIDSQTFQPPTHVYTKELLNNVDAVLLVATYGRRISHETIQHIKHEGKIVIEDCAHCALPMEPSILASDARLYSLPKMLPVPDGGLAVLPSNNPLPRHDLPPFAVSISHMKNKLKLFNRTNTVLTWAKHALRAWKRERIPVLFWSGITRPSNTTLHLLCDALARDIKRDCTPPWSYCYPFLVQNAHRAEATLRKHGLCALRLWSDPIITHPDAQRLWKIRPDTYPETLHAAEHIICAPLHHIKSAKEARTYANDLKKILAGEL